jgi:hypothetical protein
MRVRVRRANATWVTTLSSWAWFCSLTFASGRKCGPVAALAAYCKWAFTVASIGDVHLLSFVAVDFHATGEVHLHALVADRGLGGKLPTIREAALAWHHGDADIQPFDPARGAAYYVAGKTDPDVRHTCPATGPCRRNGCVHRKKFKKQSST